MEDGGSKQLRYNQESLGHTFNPPYSLVRKPAGITLLVTAEVGSIELLRGGDSGTYASTGFLGSSKRESIAGRALSVEKDDP